MPSGDGFIQGYNGQAAVDVESMLIVGSDLTTETNDKQCVKPMLEALDKVEGQLDLGKLDTLLADNGYFSQDNVKASLPPYRNRQRSFRYKQSAASERIRIQEREKERSSPEEKKILQICNESNYFKPSKEAKTQLSLVDLSTDA